MAETYTCVLCGGVFEKGWSDSDALMEFQEVFSEEMRAADTELPSLACDPCYRRAMAECPPEEAWEEHKRREAAAVKSSRPHKSPSP